MEGVLALYARPYNPKRPVICFDERPCFLTGEAVVPLPMTSGKPKREDYHYTKHGSCALLMAFEPATTGALALVGVLYRQTLGESLRAPHGQRVHRLHAAP